MSEFKGYIDSILNNILTDSKSRKDMADEIEDHLKLSKLEYMNKGYSENEAIGMAIKNFGKIEDIKVKYATAFSHFNKIIRILAGILFIPYMLIFIKVFLLNQQGNNYYSPIRINLVPFKSILYYLLNYHNLNYDIWFNNLFGLVIAFIPFGFLIPIIINKIKKLRNVIVVSASFSFIVEALQLITRNGVADIDDIILNVIGSILGYILLLLIVKSELFLKKVISNLKIAEN